MSVEKLQDVFDHGMDEWFNDKTVASGPKAPRDAQASGMARHTQDVQYDPYLAEGPEPDAPIIIPSQPKPSIRELAAKIGASVPPLPAGYNRVDVAGVIERTEPVADRPEVPKFFAKSDTYEGEIAVLERQLLEAKLKRDIQRKDLEEQERAAAMAEKERQAERDAQMRLSAIRRGTIWEPGELVSAPDQTANLSAALALLSMYMPQDQFESNPVVQRIVKQVWPE